MIGSRSMGLALVSLLSVSVSVSVLATGCGSSDKSRKSQPDPSEAGTGGADGAGGRNGAGGRAGSGGNDPGSGGAAGGAPDGGGSGGTATGGAPDGGGSGGTGESDAGDASVGADAGDAADGAAPFSGLYVGVSGNDAQPGTRAAPFATVAHAASVAQAGDTIVLLDGSFATSGAPVVIPDGVDIAADVPGAATLTGTGSNTVLSLQGSTRISGLHFSTVMRAVQYAAGAPATARLDVVGTTFQGCVEACLYLDGAVQATVTTAAGQVLATGGGGFVAARGSARVTVSGGELVDLSGPGSRTDGVFEAWGDSTIDLSDVRVTNGTARVLAARGTAEITVTDSVFATLAQQLVTLDDTSSLTLRGSDLSILPVATRYECIRAEAMSSVSLFLEDTRVHGCSVGINGALPTVLSVQGSQLYDHEWAGIDVVGAQSASTVTLTNSRFYDNGTFAIRLGDTSHPLTVTVRGSELEHGIGPSLSDALRLSATPTAVLDLGTLASPGGNTFLGNGTTTLAGLRLIGAGLTVSAVGNTWLPNVQGADDSGRYTAQPGQVTEVTGIVTGANFMLGTATTIRLAESP